MITHNLTIGQQEATTIEEVPRVPSLVEEVPRVPSLVQEVPRVPSLVQEVYPRGSRTTDTSRLPGGHIPPYIPHTSTASHLTRAADISLTPPLPVTSSAREPQVSQHNSSNARLCGPITSALQHFLPSPLSSPSGVRTGPSLGVCPSGPTHRPYCSIYNHAVQACPTFAPLGVDCTQVPWPSTQSLRGFQSPPSPSRCYPSDGRLDGD